MKTLKESLAYYRTQHRTPGCKLTHLAGIPILAAVPFAFLANRKLGFQVLFAGVALQMLGHAVFEKNEPTLLKTRDLMTVPASLIFIAEEWKEVLSGQWLKHNSLQLWTKNPMPVDSVDNAPVEDEALVVEQ
ncbi:MAG: DUF962 domain-containing protein [Candidatus Obscuribacterales bacterium]|nr:DUF962 domain-containing protein [Candidatus Obscuribacterales bacterium]